MLWTTSAQKYKITLVDDSQLYISLSPDDLDPIPWVNNKDTTKILNFGAKAWRQKIAAHLSSLSLESKSETINLSVIIDSDLNFKNHQSYHKISLVSSHIISKLRGFLCQSDSEKLIHAFMTSRIDYCGGLFTSFPAVQWLQFIQNAAACILTRTKKSGHITPVLKSLHWLQNHNQF